MHKELVNIFQSLSYVDGNENKKKNNLNQLQAKQGHWSTQSLETNLKVW